MARIIGNKSLTVWHRALGQGATFLGVLMVAFIWLSLNFYLATERENTLRAAVQNGGNLARAFEEHLSRSLMDIDRTLLMMRASYEHDPGAFDFVGWNGGAPIAGDPAMQLWIAGADGLVRMNSTGTLTASVNISDREYFRFLADNSVDVLAISKPVIGRFSGKPTIQLSRRLRNADGSFGGIITASLDPSYFTRFYNSIDIGRNGWVRVVGLDGIVRAIGGSVPEMLGRDLSEALMFAHYKDAPAGWFLSPSSLSDHIDRLVTYRAVRDFPLIVALGLASDEVLAGSIAKQRVYDTIAATLTVLILIFVAFSVWDRVKLERMTAELHTQNLRFDAALNNMSQGLCMYDASERLVVCNERYARIYGLPPAMVRPGTSMHAIIEFCVANGDHSGPANPEYTRRRIREPSEIRKGSNGRVYLIQRRPMPGGGMVTTHEDITERQRNETQIAHMARHDALTDLANRSMFMERIGEQVAQMNDDGGEFTVFLLDLDEFKLVNDSLGHPVGDALLSAIADRLRRCARDTDLVARLGGDEFAILQAGGGDQRDAAIVLATRIRDVVTAPYDIDGHKIVIGTSIGIALAPQDAREADQLLKNADLALYSAKSDGRDGFRFFEARMEVEARARRALELDLRNGIGRTEFELHYQSVVEIASGEMCGAEALIRWRHPRLGMVFPDQFIPIAEETGLIEPLGDWILHEACNEAAKWPPRMRIAVNLSPAQFRRGHLIDSVSRALAESGVAPERLELEITESVLLQKNAENLTQLHQLKALGVSIVLDDFGTGYSSLTYLNIFPFDRIKIDRSFVAELPTRANSAAIVCAVVALGLSLDMPTTAEGVETEEQLELLRAAGCREAQGYLFSRPRPARELTLAAERGEGKVA